RSRVSSCQRRLSASDVANISSWSRSRKMRRGAQVTLRREASDRAARSGYVRTPAAEPPVARAATAVSAPASQRERGLAVHACSVVGEAEVFALATLAAGQRHPAGAVRTIRKRARLTDRRGLA